MGMEAVGTTSSFVEEDLSDTEPVRTNCMTPKYKISLKDCEEILEEIYQDMDPDESVFYRISPEEVTTAKNHSRLSNVMNSDEFRYMLTYGEVEPKSVEKGLLPVFDLKSSDVFVDLGCGMGRVVIQAALQTDCKAARGIELVKLRAVEGKRALKRLRALKHPCDHIKIIHGDFSSPPHHLKLREATVVYFGLKRVELMGPLMGSFRLAH